MTFSDTNPSAETDYTFHYTTSDSGGSRTYTADQYTGDYQGYTGTLTDTAVTIYTSNMLSAIKFIDPRTWNNAGTAFLYMDMPNWYLVGIASLWFYLPIAMTTLNFWFILVGLIMIPVSTLYLVRGGRDELSSDKVFFALVIFFVGLAFFIGGIV